MCIITNAVRSVAQTQIYVSLSETLDHQLTIYSNKVDSYSENNRMILPVPNSASVQLINLHQYGGSTLFTDLDRCFRKNLVAHLYASRSASHLSSKTNTSSRLIVYDVGSYQASIVPSVNDFERLETNLLISKSLQSMLQAVLR